MPAEPRVASGPPPERSRSLALPEPALEDRGAGIVLRAWRPTGSDAAAIAAAWADPAITPAGRRPTDTSADAARRYLEAEPERRARGAALDLVVARATDPGTVLGEVGLRNVDRTRGRAEVSWWTAAAHRRRGVAATAARLLVDWALTPAGGLVQVWCRIDPANRASTRVAVAAGLRPLGRAGDGEVWARTSPPP